MSQLKKLRGSSQELRNFQILWRDKIETLLPSEISILDALAAGTVRFFPSDNQSDETPIVIRGLFIRNLLLGKLGPNLMPPSGLAIQGAHIIGDIDLRGCNVNWRILLEDCKILGIIDFSGATIVELVLTGTSVERLCLSEINCKGSIVLSYGFRTLYPVIARGAKIGGQLGCSGGHFLGYPLAISIESAKIEEAFFWRHVKDLWGIVDLTNANVGCLVDDPDSWPSKGKLRLAGFTYGSFESNTSTDYYDRLDWLERQYKPHLTDDFRPQPFEQLVKVLRATGREVEATKIAIKKLHFQRDSDFFRRNRKINALNQKIRITSNIFHRAILINALKQERKMSLLNVTLLFVASFNWFTCTLFWAFAGYGYRPARCIFWSALMIAIGGFVFSDLYESGNIVYVMQNSMSDYSGHEATVPIFYPMAYAADTFIPIIDLRQASNWVLIDGKGEPIRPFLFFYWCYIFLGWVFAAIFGASVTGLVRK